MDMGQNVLTLGQKKGKGRRSPLCVLRQVEMYD